MLSCKRFSSKTCTNRFSKASESIICECGGIGRRARLRGVFERVRVQVPSLAPITGYQACFFMYFCEYADLSGLERDSVAEQVPSLSPITGYQACFFMYFL